MQKTEFGQRLKSIRESKKLTQAKMSEIFGVSRVTISNWENAEHAPIDVIMKINELYPDVDLHWLLTGELRDNCNVLENKVSNLEVRVTAIENKLNA